MEHMERDAAGTAGQPERVPRRTVLQGAALAGVLGATGAALAGCGSEKSSSSTGSAPTGQGTTGDGMGSTGGTGGSGGAGGPVSASGIPVGGGTIVEADGQKIVVTQPVQGEFKAFDARCTHQGCPVDRVADGVIRCPCHGSRYSAADGSVQGGPAPRPLSPVNISVQGGMIQFS